MDIEIRKWRIGDISDLLRLTFQWGYETTREQLTENLHRIETATNAEVFVAETDGRVVGRIFVREHLSLGTNPFAEVHDLVVDEDYRRMGIGKQLIKKAKEWSCEKRLNVLRLRTNIKREEANAFYVQAGFKLDKVQNVYVTDLF